MTAPTTATYPSKALGNILVLVGDAQRARMLRPGADDALDVVWEAYAATPDVRSIDQAPDITRNSQDATPRVPAENVTQFAHEVADLVRRDTGERPDRRLIVIAPQRFALALKIELGQSWPSRTGDVIHRDETRLDERGVTSVIRAKLAQEAS